MEITYLGHSSFKIKSKSGTLVTDPFSSDFVGLKYPKVSTDLVTVSHDHEDHNNIDGVKDYKKIINGPGEYEISGISIFGYPTFHDDKKGELRGKNVIYLIETEGIKLLHLGDIGHKLSESMIEEIGEVDVLFLPIGGEYTINAEEAASVAGALEPKIVIPMHYLTPAHNQEKYGMLLGFDDYAKISGLTVTELDKLIIKDIAVEENKLVRLKAQNG